MALVTPRGLHHYLPPFCKGGFIRVGRSTDRRQDARTNAIGPGAGTSGNDGLSTGDECFGHAGDLGENPCWRVGNWGTEEL